MNGVRPDAGAGRGRKSRVAAALLGMALALGGCSTLKFGYNNLDWITAWQIGRFVDLAPQQKALFDDGFDEFWRWHRGTQLELYVRDLRDLAAALDRPFSTAHVEEYLARSQDHASRMLAELVPSSAQLARTLDDDQVADLLDNLASRRRARIEKTEGKSLEALQAAAAEDMEHTIDRWAGSVTREQEGRIRRWAQERAYADAVWQQYQVAWAKALGNVLAHRTEADFEQRLAGLFRNGERIPFGDEMAQVRAHNRQVWVETMADLARMLTPEQRRHFQGRLREMADDLEELAAQPLEAARTATIG